MAVCYTNLIEKQIYIKELLRDSYKNKAKVLDLYIRKTQNISLISYVENLFGESLFNDTQIKKKELISQLLRDDISLANWSFIRARLRNLPYLTDRRHTEEYAFDVALGWISEGLFKTEIERQAGVPGCVTLVGVDSEREFKSLNIKASADYSIRKEGANIMVDLFTDHKGTWANNGGMDLKPGKITHFKSGKLDYVLGFDMVNRSLYLVTTYDIEGLEAMANPAMGGTKTVRVPLPDPIPLINLFDRF